MRPTKDTRAVSALLHVAGCASCLHPGLKVAYTWLSSAWLLGL